MKPYIIKYIIVLSFLTAFISSCSKEYLDTKQDGVTTQSDFYKTDTDAQQALFAAYDAIQGASPADWHLMKNMLSDDVYAGGGQRGDLAFFAEINEYRFGTSNSTINSVFTLYYKCIYLCNKVVDNVTPDTPVKKLAIAEAKALRAYSYFELTTMWGPVPLVLHELTPTEYAQPNSTVNALWTQIEKDLNESITGLPLKSSLSAANKGRISKGTAQAWLGKALLYQKKYSEAATQFDLVINSNEYALNPDYSSILKKESEFGVESVFEFNHTTNLSTSSESNGAIFMTGPRVGWFTPGNSGLSYGWGFLIPQAGIFQAYVDAGDLVRRKAALMNEEELAALGGSMRQNGTLQYGSSGYIRLKYAPWMSETQGSDYTTHFGTNIRITRYADVLLMAAEAYNRSTTPNDAKALGYINAVRNRVGLSPLTSTGDALFVDIKKERRLEFSFEFIRYQDLVRWGDAAAVLANQGKSLPKGDGTFYSFPDAGFKAKNVLLPIPESEMNVNKNIKQNTGW